MNINKLIYKFPNCNHLQKLKNISLPTINLSIKQIQKGYINFYDKNHISPYIPIAASGPWIITNENKVVYDVGGYGMLGLGHNPDNLLSILSKPQVMANIMTANKSQYIFRKKIENEISPAYKNIICLNSGSEANTLAMRIANTHTNKKPVQISLVDSFHGRTEMPAKVSSSCRNTYNKYLQQFSNIDSTYFIRINDFFFFI